MKVKLKVNDSTIITFFQESAVVLTLRKPKSSKKVEWTQDTVDNEHMGRKKSKCTLHYYHSLHFYNEIVSSFLQAVASTGSLINSGRVLQNPRTTSATIVKDTSSSRMPKPATLRRNRVFDGNHPSRFGITFL